MSDATIQARLQTLLQALDNFADADVVLGDLRVLGRGSSPYAIIFPGPFRSERAGDWSQVVFVWSFLVEVWDRFTGDSYTSIVAARQAVVDCIAKYPTLNGLSGVAHALVEASDMPIYLWQKGTSPDAQPTFVGFRLTVTCIEHVLYSGSGEFTTS
jgi:hypothetical protein